MTNFERIKKMSEEELANFLHNIQYSCDICVYTFGKCKLGQCTQGVRKWLEQKEASE